MVGGDSNHGGIMEVSARRGKEVRPRRRALGGNVEVSPHSKALGGNVEVSPHNVEMIRPKAGARRVEVSSARICRLGGKTMSQRFPWHTLRMS